MLKVLVVDDDKLVRKGLISAMPWEQFGMQVIGEASNGEKALEMMELYQVDLLLTDLAMPVMSGLELMRIVRKRYPKTHIVVLTLHQDFEYIQEALRLGAVDYIAKVQLEKERFEEVLERIRHLIMQKRKEDSLRENFSGTFISDLGYVLMSTEDQAGLQWLEHAVTPSLDPFHEIADSIWLWVPGTESKHHQIFAEIAQAILYRSGWILIRLTNLLGKKQLDIYRKLVLYRQRELFYTYREEERILSMSAHEFTFETREKGDHEYAFLKKQWLSWEWINHDDLFMKLRNDLKAVRLPVSKLLALIYEMATVWNRTYGSVIPYVMNAPETLKSWQETEQWLIRTRESMIRTTSRLHYSREVINCIMEAVKIMQEEIDRPLFAVHVAKRVNMSRSYFNRCFKDIVGRSFNDYLRFLRIEKAKSYLQKTNQSVQWIAEKTGYMDEKYFSRVFREQTGMTPSDYRRSVREEK